MSMNQPDIQKVRALDIQWAHAFNVQITGHRFTPAKSEATGSWMDADEVALVSLHRLRTRLGSKKERKESTAWLRERGLKGLFDAELADQ